MEQSTSRAHRRIIRCVWTGLGAAAISAALVVGAGCDDATAEPDDCRSDVSTRPQGDEPTPAAAPPAQASAAPAEPATKPAAAPEPDARPARAKRSAPSEDRAAEIAEQLRVKRLVVARGVEGREPVEASTSFTADDERVYAFVEMHNPAKEPSAVVVSFEPPDGGVATGNVELAVGPSPRWRTWAFTRGAQQEGQWTAVVRTLDGKVLAREPFEVTL